MNDTDDPYERLGRLAYDAYGHTTDGRNFRGEPMPHWSNLGDTIQSAWISAAKRVKDEVERCGSA